MEPIVAAYFLLALSGAIATLAALYFAKWGF